MRWRELFTNLGVALLAVVAFLVMLAVVGCASPRSQVQQQCERVTGGAVTCTCTGAP